MKNLRTIIFGLMTVAMLLFFEINTAKAVCDPPPDDLGGYEMEWSEMECCTLNITVGEISCTYVACYYWREPNPSAYLIEISVCYDFYAIGDCDLGQYYTIAQIAKFIGEAILETNCNGNNWPCPPPPYSNPNYRLYLAGCFYNGNPCANPGAWCKQEYAITCLPPDGRPVLTEIGNATTIGSCTAPCQIDCDIDE